MSQPMPEPEDLRVHRGKVWTYLIGLVVLLLLVVAVNVVWKNPDAARSEMHGFLGLPLWALASIGAAVGILIFWLGLKVEADWPEALGSFLVAAAVTTFEYILGWHRFELGLVVVPYLIPVLVFVIMLAVGVKKSV